MTEQLHLCCTGTSTPGDESMDEESNGAEGGEEGEGGEGGVDDDGGDDDGGRRDFVELMMGCGGESMEEGPCDSLQLTHHTSHITHHTSHITHHISHITHHTSHITIATSSESLIKCNHRLVLSSASGGVLMVGGLMFRRQDGNPVLHVTNQTSHVTSHAAHQPAATTLPSL